MKNCPACGVLHEDSATKCEKCGKPLFPVGAYRRIDDHLVEAILTTIFCCLPFGVVAIVYAAQVRSMVRMGDIQEAMRVSESARFWSSVSFWIGLVTVGLSLLLGACNAVFH
jgi:hypothetical protein